MSVIHDIDEDDEDYGIVWWDDLEITGKEARDKKNMDALEDRLNRLYQYCITDVEAERAADDLLFPLPPTEEQVYFFDQRINDRGIAIDVDTVKKAMELIDRSVIEINKEAEKLTDGAVTAVSQRDRLVSWLETQGVVLPALDKSAINDALADISIPLNVREVLRLRQLGSKTSVKKLQAMMNMVDDDNRIRGHLLYHGASTGRFSGKGVQLHNLPRPTLKKPEQVIPYIQRLAYGEIELGFGPIQNIISDCIRSLIIAGPGKTFYAADFAAIEARVLAWISGQDDLVAQFATGDDIYLAFASEIYKRVLNRKEHDFERQVGKASILGLGFMMGSMKFELTCHKAGIFLDAGEYDRIVKLYRKRYKKIVEFWYEFEKYCIRAVKNPNKVYTYRMFRFRMRDGNLRVQLPSGRALNYVEAEVVQNTTPWGEVRAAVEISAVNSFTRKWERTIVSPGTFTENVVQAIARDLMVAAMFRVEEHGYPVVLTVHDELVSEVDSGYGSVQEYESLVAATPDWAAGLPVKAEGWSGPRYKK